MVGDGAPHGPREQAGSSRTGQLIEGLEAVRQVRVLCPDGGAGAGQDLYGGLGYDPGERRLIRFGTLLDRHPLCRTGQKCSRRQGFFVLAGDYEESMRVLEHLVHELMVRCGCGHGHG
ncbi:hypothetical protein ACFY2Z_28480 [Streptomyces sp. NPDC001222]|uniref:hypothetical protein n=1 Tax=Streptomyces sp. NPDC001222 TaxID=3364548 RepID=UPI0036811697